MTQTTEKTGAAMFEHPGVLSGRTEGGAFIVKLKIGRRLMPICLPGIEYERLAIYSSGRHGVVATDDPALAAKLQLAVEQLQEAYDEEKRLG